MSYSLHDPINGDGQDRVAPFSPYNEESGQFSYHETFDHVSDDDEPGHVNFESLDYDPMENFVYNNSLVAKTMQGFQRENVLRWVVVILIGTLTALFALAIDLGVTSIAGFKFKLTRNIISKCGDCFALPFITYVCSNFLLISIASFLVAFVEPLAAGSGIPEIKAYLNGVHVPRVVRLRTLLAKAVGVMFSVAGGLPCGKEGPMIHTGAIIAAGVSQGRSETLPFFGRKRRVVPKTEDEDTSEVLPPPNNELDESEDDGYVVYEEPRGLFSSFRNDNDKRDFVSSGAAAGVAAAFGAPVGGVLFALEEGASFWNQALTWRTFACSMFCSFVLNVLVSGIVLGQWGNLSQPGLATFGSFTAQGNPGYTLVQIPFFLILGVMGGLCGALFNYVNIRLAMIRRKYITSPWGRMLEALLVSGLVSSASFALSYYARDCVALEPRCAPTLRMSSAVATPVFLTDDMFMKQMDSLANPNATCLEQINPDTFDYFCAKGEYNAMARIFFTTQEQAIRSLFHSEGEFGLRTLSIFFVVYLSLACLTYGVAVPSGLFVPAILAGCSLGRLVGHVLKDLLPPSVAIDAGVFALVGGAAVLGGIVRMTISLTIIIVESTNDITYGLPVMMTLMVAKWVGDYFNEGIYDWHIHLAGVPFLEWEPPIVMRKFKAVHVMNKPVVCFRELERVSRIVEVLRSCRHNGFPVVDKETRFRGLILRSQLITLLRNGCFKRERGIILARKELFDRDYPRAPPIEDVHLTDTEMNEWIDMTPYMNLPYTIRVQTTLSRVFRLFRTMGLRHLVVVDIGNHVVGIICRKDLTHLESRLIAQRRKKQRRRAASRRESSQDGSLGSMGSIGLLMRGHDSMASIGGDGEDVHFEDGDEIRRASSGFGSENYFS